MIYTVELLLFYVFFLTIQRPPRSTLTDTLLPYTTLFRSPDFYMTDISNFKNFYVVEGRHSGLDQIEIRDYATNTPKRIAFPEDSYTAGLDDNPEYDVTKMRISRSEERRGGKECVRTWRSRWSPYN